MKFRYRRWRALSPHLKHSNETDRDTVKVSLVDSPLGSTKLHPTLYRKGGRISNSKERKTHIESQIRAGWGRDAQLTTYGESKRLTDLDPETLPTGAENHSEEF